METSFRNQKTDPPYHALKPLINLNQVGFYEMNEGKRFYMRISKPIHLIEANRRMIGIYDLDSKYRVIQKLGFSDYEVEAMQKDFVMQIESARVKDSAQVKR